MSSENWKLEKDLCRCCHSEGSFTNLSEPVRTTGLAEIYADMLNECFDIDMAPVPGLLSAATYTICEVCVIRLRDASDFKKQVLSCEERFKDLYNRNGIKAAEVPSVVDIEVKQEIPDSDSDVDLKVELAQDDTNDDDYNINDESMDFKISEQEEEKPPEVEVRKKRKYKTRKTVACKNSKTKKKKNETEEKAEERNDAEKKKGQEKQLFNIKEEYKKVGDRIQCNRCEKTFIRLKSLRFHLLTTHFKTPRCKCDICDELHMTETLLTVHKLEVHNVDVRKRCGLCNQVFKHLSRHMKSFHMLGEHGKRYKCEFCDYETLKHERWVKHQAVHKTEKNFHCSFCQKSFKRRQTLVIHERIHTGDRRKVCSECGQAFVQKASLNYHMMKNHPAVKF